MSKEEQDWKTKIGWAKSRPAMFVGNQNTAHLGAISGALGLVRRAQAFHNPGEATVQLSPLQYVVICEAGPLLLSVEEAFTWEGKYIINNGWSDVISQLREKRRVVTLREGDDLVGWERYFGAPTGPTLETPIYPAILARRFIIAYKTSQGFWCQCFHQGIPEAKPFLLKQKSPIGLLVAAELDLEWFTGLPYTENDVKKLSSSSGITCQWHPQNDLFLHDASAKDELQKLLI